VPANGHHAIAEFAGDIHPKFTSSWNFLIEVGIRVGRNGCYSYSLAIGSNYEGLN
jgi:hypothetical protein